MGEVWASTSEGRHLAGRKKRDTKPELQLRRALHAAGARYRVQRRLGKGCTPDIVMPGRRLAMFVDGCFWRGCPKHGRRTPWSGPNAALWEAKMERNHQRDDRSSAIADAAGWHVLRVWECDIAANPRGVANYILTTFATHAA